MILSASATYRVFIQHAQSHHRLARVENLRASSAYRIHKSPRDRGNSAQSLQQVQDHAFAGEQRPRVMPDIRDDLALVQPNAIEDFRMSRNLRVSDDIGLEHRVYLKDALDRTHA